MTSTPPTINVLLVEDNPADVGPRPGGGLGAATEAQFELHTACRLTEAPAAVSDPAV